MAYLPEGENLRTLARWRHVRIYECLARPVSLDHRAYAAPLIDLAPCWRDKLLRSIAASLVILFLLTVQAGILAPAVAADPESFAEKKRCHYSGADAPRMVKISGLPDSKRTSSSRYSIL